MHDSAVCGSMQVMVANIRCGEILNDQLKALQEDQAWTSLVQNTEQHLVPDFGSQASNLLESCLSGKLSHAAVPFFMRFDLARLVAQSLCHQPCMHQEGTCTHD